jgi:hypothetical protein
MKLSLILLTGAAVLTASAPVNSPEHNKTRVEEVGEATTQTIVSFLNGALHTVKRNIIEEIKHRHSRPGHHLNDTGLGIITYQRKPHSNHTGEHWKFNFNVTDGRHSKPHHGKPHINHSGPHHGHHGKPHGNHTRDEFSEALKSLFFPDTPSFPEGRHGKPHFNRTKGHHNSHLALDKIHSRDLNSTLEEHNKATPKMIEGILATVRALSPVKFNTTVPEHIFTAAGYNLTAAEKNITLTGYNITHHDQLLSRSTLEEEKQAKIDEIKKMLEDAAENFGKSLLKGALSSLESTNATAAASNITTAAEKNITAPQNKAMTKAPFPFLPFFPKNVTLIPGLNTTTTEGENEDAEIVDDAEESEKQLLDLPAPKIGIAHLANMTTTLRHPVPVPDDK